MQVILLERIAKLGQMGDEVRVKDGYARNFLLPNHKALRANNANRQKFEGQRAQLEARNLELKSEAERVGETIDGKVLVLVRQAGETGQLYGSVSTRDVAEALTKSGASVSRNQIVLNQPIKTIGLHALPVRLHPEVEVSVTVNVARSEAEAERQASGEDLTQREEGPAFETFSEDDDDDRRGRRRDRDDRDDEGEATDGEDQPAA
ncbi:50S ribosomal protein L9 [Methylopila sp. M107]|uniref:50S ribosomal protein L9 n=1 Tax=Methylopila sp. M107 TaxID=1101190 RepID=UPI000380E0D4|nr:50S ribosomal protein L9 [Methylopila sp. M107]